MVINIVNFASQYGPLRHISHRNDFDFFAEVYVA